jgi:hypothetical protein
MLAPFNFFSIDIDKFSLLLETFKRSCVDCLPVLMRDDDITDLKLFNDEEKYMPSSNDVLPSLFLPRIILMLWCGVNVIKSSALRLDAVN